MKAVIIDDEQKVRDTITALLAGQFPDISVVSSEGTVSGGAEAILRFTPDLLFLDIELPDGNGFDLLKKFPSVAFKVIFITGHQEYALDAIKVSALDYILKPVDTDELRHAVEKARDLISHEEQQMKLQALAENLQGKRVLKRIILPTSDHLHLVSVSDIIRAEADSNYTSFFLSGGKHILVSKTIKEFDTLLSASGMIRVHQSHLVNISYIDKYVRKDGGWLLLKDNTRIPVSPLLRKQVLAALTEHLYE